MWRLVRGKVFRGKSSDVLGGEIVEATNVNLVQTRLQSICVRSVIGGVQYRCGFMRVVLFYCQLLFQAVNREPGLTDGSMFGIASIPGISRSSAKPMSKSISMSISAILNEWASDLAETLQAILDWRMEDARRFASIFWGRVGEGWEEMKYGTVL
jgi:hypothetical protein